MKVVVLMLMFASGGAKPPEICVPTTPVPLNGFVSEYNKYIDKLQRGEVDIRQWERVEKKWKDLHSLCKLY